MTAAFVNRIELFLDELEATQQDMVQLFERKRTALVQARAQELLAVAEAEARLAEKLRSALHNRRQILDDAARDRLPAHSLIDLAEAVAGADQPRLRPRMEQARQMSDRLRRESWMHWIVCHRTCAHYTELLNLIAHQGQHAAAYSQGPDEQSTGGVIIDTSI